MNNEPVAWMIIDVDNGKSLQFKENKFSEINIPLYTAPKYKEPTTAEIMELWLDVINNTNPNDKRPHEWHFACALLKKASLR
jgi:hypothetical protein